MDGSFSGGFTQDTAGRRSTGRARGQPWVPVLTSDVHGLLPGQDAIRIGALESSEVTIVGVIRASQRNSNMASVDYFVDDHAGPPLLVHQLIEEERDGQAAPLTAGTYVRVIGKIRTWDNERGLIAFSVTPLTSLNELSMHLLEMKHCRLFYTKDVLRRREELAQKNGTWSNAGHTNAAPAASTSTTSAASASAYPINSNTAGFSGESSSGLTGLDAEIHKFLNTCTSECGYALTDIQRRFAHIGQGKVRHHLDFLLGEGHIYTTIDDDHFRTTDS